MYLAEDPVITRKVAIKVISARPGQADPELQARFEREFRSVGTLSHPNIVAIHDVGKQGTRTFIAMEYVEGKSRGRRRDAVSQRWSARRAARPSPPAVAG